MSDHHTYINRASGFTLIELIIVVAIIGLLAAALFVAVDPAKRLGLAKDAQRWSDVTSVLNAILTYTNDIAALPTAVQNLTRGQIHALGSAGGAADNFGCRSLTGETVSLTAVSFGADLVDKYIATIPKDPDYTTTTGYYIVRSANDRITVGACMKSTYTTGSLQVTR